MPDYRIREKNSGIALKYPLKETFGSTQNALFPENFSNVVKFGLPVIKRDALYKIFTAITVFLNMF